MQALIKHHLEQAVRDVAQSMGRRRWPTEKQGEQLMLDQTGLVAEALLSRWRFDPVLLATEFDSGAMSKGESAVRRMALWLSTSFQPEDSSEEQGSVESEDDEEDLEE